MTAKELHLVAKHTALAYNMPKAVVFSDDGFKAFIDQLCLEQRHNCQTEYNKNSYCDENGEWYVSCVDILNAPKPTI